MMSNSDTVQLLAEKTNVAKPTNANYVINERRRAALAEIDNAKFSLFHAKVCLVAGVGFFTDAYDIFAINIASVMLGYIYGHVSPMPNVGDPGPPILNTQQDLGVKVATPVGTLIGQLLFGWLADIVGRKRMYGVELMIIIVATFAQALSSDGHAVSIVGVLVVWRFLVGVGIGGDYPLSAVISSEFASTRIRGRMMTAVFAAQGWGNLGAAVVAAITVTAYKNTLLNDSDNLEHVDVIWRILIGLGCVPGTIALYFRLTIPETPRFTMDIERNVLQATTDIENVLTRGNSRTDPDSVIQRANAPKASYADFCKHFGQWKNFKILFGTSYSWFALDVAFYGLSLNSSIILGAIHFGGSAWDSNHMQLSAYDALYNICIGNIVLALAGLIPGYYFSFLFIDSWGRKKIQLMGFIVLTILFMIMGFGYDKLVVITSEGKTANPGFVVLYCLANFFQNFGPNTTTFVIPGEAFPTRYRSTAHGISAASGKLGAIIAQVGFAKLKDIHGTNNFIKHILEIFAFFMLTGIFSTLLLPETKQQTLEQLSNEDQDDFITGMVGRVEAENGVIIIQREGNTSSGSVSS